VVVEIVLSWSAIDETSCCGDAVNEEAACGKVGDMVLLVDNFDMDADGEWPF
jgi:hypothetical protein